MNKFYYFTLIYFCISFSESKKKFELISGSTLISIYLFIWNLIISLIRDLSSLNRLYITQIVFASIPSLIVAYFIISFIFSTLCSFCKCESFECFGILFCLCCFLCCFGGFWINIFLDIDNCDCDCDCDCCDLNCYCCIDCFDCLDCCCCRCCDCCECYDCFGCCDCFYCCGNSCSCFCC